jgi:2-phosphoglycerate kinase
MVLDRVEGVRTPFLRGILTRSLQNAGLPFKEAYEIASAVRAELDDTEEITTDALRKRVVSHLEGHGAAVVARYRSPLTRATLVLRSADGDTTTFSRGGHRTTLQACGIPAADAASIASRILADFTLHGVGEISEEDLRRSTYEHIQRVLGDEAARHYLVWEEFKASGRPLVVVIGGTDGSGKSTITTNVAHTLGIMKTQSTDLLREVMRVMIPERLLPFLHTSSFKAWEVLPAADRSSEDPEAFVADGYLTQAELVSVACVATIQRAVQERVSLILEGVHVHPLLLRRIPADLDAIVVPVMLGVLKPTELRHRLRGRSKAAPARRKRRHVENFESIWRLQSFLLSEADRAGVPIVVNEERERTLQQVIGVVIGVLAKEFRGDPDELLAG